MKLYELTEAYAELMMQYEDAENDVERARTLHALTNLEDDIEVKAENIVRIIKDRESKINAYSNEIERLSEKRRIEKYAIERLKSYALFAMGIAGATSIETTIGKLSVQMNPPKVEVVDISKVPARFLIEQEPTVNKSAMLKEHRLTGEIFPGVEITRSEGLRLR